MEDPKMTPKTPRVPAPACAAAGSPKPRAARALPAPRGDRSTSDQWLVAFRACKPGRVREIGAAARGGDSALVGIDSACRTARSTASATVAVRTRRPTTAQASFVSRFVA
jgi:hypothetical protein